MGYIKYSISVTTSGDARSNLEQKSLESAEKQELSIPMNIQLKYKQIIIRLFKAKNLVAMDDNGRSDPYVKFYLSDIEIKSKIVEKTLEPYFYQKLYLPTIYPSMAQKLKMVIKDRVYLNSKTFS